MNINAVGNAMQPLQKAGLDPQSAQSGAVTGPAPQRGAASASEPQKKELKASVEAINDFLKSFSNNIEFSIDDDSGRTIVKLVDTETHTVLRQYPTREALAIARDIENFQGHLLKTDV
jgi:flagellar protein FlaG